MNRLKALTLGCATAAALMLSACSAPSDTGSGDPAKNGATNASSGLTVTDVKDRTVEFDKAPERIVLGEGRGIFATAILNKDKPADKVVAMGTDLAKAAPSYYEKITTTNPELESIPQIGHIGKGDVTIEEIVSFKPDVMVISADQYDDISTTGMKDKLEAADIKYVVTDFRQHPMENTTKSVDILGQLTGQTESAADFNKEWTETVDLVRDRASKAKDRPKTFLWRAAGLKDCCATVKESNLGEMVNLAGGDNLADHVLATEEGSMTPEKLIADQPDVIIATGGSWAPDPKKKQPLPHTTLGYKSESADAARTLTGLLKTPGFDQLKAPKDGKFYGVWHQFYDSPFNYVALLQFGKWLHPELFDDINVEQKWKEAHEKFTPFDASGTFFTAQK